MEFYYEGTTKILYTKHYGLWYEVVAVFTNVEDANVYMENDRYADSCVLFAHGNTVVLADKNDKGQKLV